MLRGRSDIYISLDRIRRALNDGNDAIEFIRDVDSVGVGINRDAFGTRDQRNVGNDRVVSRTY